MAEREQSENLEGYGAEIPMDAEAARRWLASFKKMLDEFEQADIDYETKKAMRELQGELQAGRRFLKLMRFF